MIFDQKNFLAAWMAILFASVPGLLAAADETATPAAGSEQDNLGKFLPLPIFITEPAIGEGLGAALIYFHREVPRDDGIGITTGREFGKTGRKSKPPPTATGIFGAYTNDDTALAGIGHSNSFADDRYRLVVATAEARINSTFYVADRPFDFTLEGNLLYSSLKRRLGDSNAFIGLTLSYGDANVDFRTGLAEFDDASLLDFNFVDTGLAVSLIYDTRDNTLMPASGYIVDLTGWQYDDTLGGDFDYRNVNFKANAYYNLGRDYVLGLRLDANEVDGRPPFYASPYVKLRGIPALRYQGESAGAVEIELRRRLGERWQASLFTGSGSVDSRDGRIETDDDISTIGIGLRYLAVREQDTWIGIDIAEGPEDVAWYIQMGNAW